MTRPGLLALSVGFALAAAGCLEAFTTVEKTTTRNKPVETPKVPEASVAAAARVDQVGHDLMAATLFFPVDPTFHTAARSEVFVTHPDLNGVMVSEGLVKKCRTDAQLAAVLAAELGRMAAEKWAADRLRPGAAPADRGPDSGSATDPRATAAELLTAAGYSAKDLDAAGPLLKEAEGNRKLTASLAPRAAAPSWSP